MFCDGIARRGQSYRQNVPAKISICCRCELKEFVGGIRESPKRGGHRGGHFITYRGTGLQGYRGTGWTRLCCIIFARDNGYMLSLSSGCAPGSVEHLHVSDCLYYRGSSPLIEHLCGPKLVQSVGPLGGLKYDDIFPNALVRRLFDIDGNGPHGVLSAARCQGVEARRHAVRSPSSPYLYHEDTV
eukprot:610943-Prorocentrum_minimum.AAC.5